MHHNFFYLWITPFFIPLAGFLFSKTPFFKKTRITINVLLLFAAFMMDLHNVSLRSVSASLIYGFVLMTIIMKISWSALSMRVKLFRYVIVTAGLVIFIVKYGEWMGSSSETVRSWYFPVSVQTHRKNDRNFEIRELMMVHRNKNSRLFKFGTTHISSLFIKWLDSYPVPESYLRARFKYRWYLDPDAGMTASLIGEADTLWKLKEILYMEKK
jgi:hypothetical protein